MRPLRSALTISLLVIALAFGASATGASATSSPGARTLACDGAWHRVPVSTSRDFTYLTDADALDANEVWALGAGWDSRPLSGRTPARAEAAQPPAFVPGAVRDAAPMPTGTRGPVFRGDGSRSGPVILRWDGVAWQEEPAPHPASRWDSLEALSVLSPTDVWAVGGRALDWEGAPWIEHWDGVSWSFVPAPAIAGSAWLFDVEALSPTNVWAVGVWNDRKSERGLLLHYDGIAWSVVTGPKIWDGWFNAAAATGGSDIWVAGLANRITGRQGLYLQHYDGVSWTPSATGGHDPGEGTGLAVFSGTDAWVSGYIWGWRTMRPFAERWDGVSWTRVDVPNLGDFGTTAEDVAGTSGNDAWLVGGTYRPWGRGWLVPTAVGYHWDGVSWTPVEVPTPHDISYLASIEVTPDGSGFAVGTSEYRPSGAKPFIAQACGI